jgi:hypothetical protein
MNATRVNGYKTGHVVVDGPVSRDTIDPRRVVMEFRDRPKAEAHAAMLNGKRAPTSRGSSAEPRTEGGSDARRDAW